MKQEISFDERKKIQLEMLDEIDAFCRNNNIRYSIAFGTLLGAVRHKGFIPWDDDVDIMMPLPDMIKFKKLFQSDKLRYIDYTTSKHYAFPFSRIAHKQTYNKAGLTYKDYGICIDLYVMIGIPDNYEEFFEGATPLYKKRLAMMDRRSWWINKLPISTIPGYRKAISDYCTYILDGKDYVDANTFYIIATPLSKREKAIYDRDLFSSMIELPFEGKKYMAISEWNYFLTLQYGDYMQPPPESERVPYHGGHYFWK